MLHSDNIYTDSIKTTIYFISAYLLLLYFIRIMYINLFFVYTGTTEFSPKRELITLSFGSIEWNEMFFIAKMCQWNEPLVEYICWMLTKFIATI